MTHSKGTYLKGCRCPVCTEAWARWHREYRQRRRPAGPWRCLICDANFPTARARDLHELYLHDRYQKRTA